VHKWFISRLGRNTAHILRYFFEVNNLLWSRPTLCAGCARTAIDIFARRKELHTNVDCPAIRENHRELYIYEITVDSGGTHNEVSRELRLQLPPVKSFPEGTETGMVSASLDEPRRWIRVEQFHAPSILAYIENRMQPNYIRIYREICSCFSPALYNETERLITTIDNNSMCFFFFYKRTRVVLRSFWMIPKILTFFFSLRKHVM